VAEWQTQRIQNPPTKNRVGSTPTFGTLARIIHLHLLRVTIRFEKRVVRRSSFVNVLQHVSSLRCGVRQFFWRFVPARQRASE
jgi:hypothetical protein